MARYPHVDVALADEGGYVARWEENADIMPSLSIFVFLMYIMYFGWENRTPFFFWRARKLVD